MSQTRCLIIAYNARRTDIQEQLRVASRVEVARGGGAHDKLRATRVHKHCGVAIHAAAHVLASVVRVRLNRTRLRKA
jgi:hypothetical protein